jgi:DNA-binding NarL/FixJ family response regulator
MSDVSITRLAIVDCHPVVGRGLRDMLAAEADLDVVYECNSFDACCEMFGTTEVDLMVLDLTTAGLCGLHSLARARSLWPELPIIVLSDNVGCSRLALQLGAQGFVSTQDDEADILRVVRSAARGGISVGEHELDHLVTTEFRLEQQPDDTELSVRDVLMLDLMARGVPLREIAEHLHVTPKTVRSYRHQLEAKLDASTVNDLVLKAGKALRADASDER